jgi:hypothetical protein
MTLNKFLASKGIRLNSKQKVFLGRNFTNCAIQQGYELTKRDIKENGKEMSVNKYPMEFLKTKGEKLLARFLRKYKINQSLT